MYLSVSGSAATSKAAVVEMLKRAGFEFLSYSLTREIDSESPPPDDSPAILDLKHAFMRTKLQLQAQEVMARQDVVTVRTAYESIIFAEASQQRYPRPDDGFELMKFYLSSIEPLLKPPHAIIWLTASPMTTFDRAKLNQQEIDREYFKLLSEGYKKFMAEVAIPVIEIEADKPFEEIRGEVEYGINSLRSAQLIGQSVWSRRMFR